jgi:alpha-galactosidase
MDINQERLDGSYNLCRRYAEELGVEINFEKTLNREESLSGADFVINTALAAGHQHLRSGWDIAIPRGYHNESFYI